jgi:hypothetical protein
MTESTYILLTDPTDPRHGTINGYTNHGCRCGPCTGANTSEQQKARDRRSALEIPPEVHGTENGYSNYNCRCEDCKAAHNQAAREYRASKKARHR